LMGIERHRGAFLLTIRYNQSEEVDYVVNLINGEQPW